MCLLHRPKRKENKNKNKNKIKRKIDKRKIKC